MPFIQVKEKESFDEAAFQTWYKGHAERLDLDLNPDAPEHFYDFRAAYRAGEGPDETGHWPSQFKKEGHPRRFVKIESNLDGEFNRLMEDAPPEERKKQEGRFVRSAIYSSMFDISPEQAYELEPVMTEERARSHGVTRSFEKLTFSEKIKNMPNAAAYGFATIPAGILKSIGIAAKDLDDALPRVLQSYEDKDLQDLVTYKAGQSIANWAKRAFPTDPSLQRNFVFNMLPEGLGQMVGFLSTGVISKTATIPRLLMVMLTGASVEAPAMYEEAISHGADEETARMAARWGGLIGTTEAVPIERIFNRFNRASGGQLRRFLIEALSGGIQEFTQEAFQTGAENVMAQQLYDKERELFEGVVESGSAGGILGFFMNAMAMGLGVRIRGRRISKPNIDDFIEEGQTVEEAIEKQLHPLLTNEELAAIKAERSRTKRQRFLDMMGTSRQLSEEERAAQRAEAERQLNEYERTVVDKGRIQGPPPALEEFRLVTEELEVVPVRPSMLPVNMPMGKLGTPPASEILTFIRKAGGINPELAQGEMERFSTKEAGTTGLANRKGLDPDAMRKKLQKAGYLDEDSSINDMYDLMDLELYRSRFGEVMADYPIGEIMSGAEKLNIAIKKAETAIKRAEAAGLREGIQQERARKKALEERKKTRKQAREFAQKMARVIMRPVGKSVDFYYREAIENLRAGIDPSFRAKKTIEHRERLRRFLELHPNQVQDLPLSLLNIISKKALNEYTMKELEDIAVETVRLRRLGRLKKDMDRAQEKRRLEDEVNQITFNVLKGMKIEPSETPITSATAREARSRRAVTAARAYTLRPSRIFDKMDGGQNFQGPTHRIFYDQVNHAETIKLMMTDQRLDRGKAKLEELGITVKALAKTRKVQGPPPALEEFRLVTEELEAAPEEKAKPAKKVGGQSFTVDEMIDVYVGMKNPRKFLAVIYGNNISPEMCDEIAKALTPKERALGDWLINEYDDNYMRLREAFINYTDEDMGHEPNYTPMRRRDVTYDELRAEIADEFLHRSYLKKGYTPKGFTVARQEIPPEYQIPVFLGAYSTWLEQVPKQEQFINLGDITKHLHRVTNHLKFKAAVRQEFGDEYVKAIDNYVSRAANPNIYKSFDTVHRAAATLRQNVAMAYLAYNLVTMGKQLPSVALYLTDAGPGHLLGAAWEFVTDPVGTIKFLEERSPQLSWRHRSMERELEEFRTQERGKFDRIRKKLGRIGMMGIYAFDRLAISIGFKAVYNRAMADGYSEAEAIKMAEHSTLRTQPAAAAKDLAQIYASNEFLNWFTQFTNQLNQIYNIATHDIPAAMKKGRFYDAFLGTLSLAITALAIWMMTHRRLPEDPDDFKEAVGEEFMNAIPVFGRQISSAATGWQGSNVPMLKGAEAVGVAAGDTSSKAKIKALLEGIAVTFGIPYTGPKRVIKTVTEEDIRELVGGEPREKRGKKGKRRVRRQR